LLATAAPQTPCSGSTATIENVAVKSDGPVESAGSALAMLEHATVTNKNQPETRPWNITHTPSTSTGHKL
jgi:hypothetical protein